MAAGNWIPYGSFVEALGNKEHDLGADVFKIIILGNAYTPDHDDAALTDVSANEASNYTRPTLANVAWTRTALSAVPKFDADDVTITPSGGNMLAAYAVIYNDTHASDAVVAYCVLDGGADVTVPSGVDFTLIMAAAGIFTATAVDS